MYTIHEFTSRWKWLHSPSMPVDADVNTYYRLYCELYALVGRDARHSIHRRILAILLYVENIIATGLDGVYEYRYRSVGNVLDDWCHALGLSTAACSRVDSLVDQAVADARHSALRLWITDSVLSGDIARLSEVLVSLAHDDRVLRRVFPTLRYRLRAFTLLAGDRQTAWQMLWTDLAFNWRDKRGFSLADTLASQLRQPTFAADEEESDRLRQVADRLDTIHPMRMDTYTIERRKDARTLALRHRDGSLLDDVILATPFAEGSLPRYLAAQLVAYRGQTYAVAPIVCPADATWNGDTTWPRVTAQEQEAARHQTYTTPFGKRLSLYDDLYTVPEDPEEAYYADMGIYRDEPNILSFLETLRSPDATENTVE